MSKKLRSKKVTINNVTGFAAIDAAIAAAVACPVTCLGCVSTCSTNMVCTPGNPAFGLMTSGGGSYAGKVGKKQRRRTTDLYSTSNVSGACSTWCNCPGPLSSVMYGATPYCPVYTDKLL